MIDNEYIKSLFKISPKDINLYKSAFVHKSAVETLCSSSYERLEFVGDSVVNMITAKYLYTKFPNENEGFMSKTRTKVVCTQGLSSIAKQLKLSDKIEMDSKGILNKYNENDKILEDVFEALMGAIFIDLGYEITEQVFVDIMEKYIDWKVLDQKNYKDILSNFAKDKNFNKIDYTIIKKEKNEYIAQVIIDGIYLSEGAHTQKKKAEIIAAQRALKSMNIV